MEEENADGAEAKNGWRSRFRGKRGSVCFGAKRRTWKKNACESTENVQNWMQIRNQVNWPRKEMALFFSIVHFVFDLLSPYSASLLSIENSTTTLICMNICVLRRIRDDIERATKVIFMNIYSLEIAVTLPNRWNLRVFLPCHCLLLALFSSTLSPLLFSSLDWLPHFRLLHLILSWFLYSMLFLFSSFIHQLLSSFFTSLPSLHNSWLFMLENRVSHFLDYILPILFSYSDFFSFISSLLRAEQTKNWLLRFASICHKQPTQKPIRVNWSIRLILITTSLFWFFIS